MSTSCGWCLRVQVQFGCTMRRCTEMLQQRLWKRVCSRHQLFTSGRRSSYPSNHSFTCWRSNWNMSIKSEYKK
uniref:Secreted protein n=1 Tax=Ascaris lumbricoides TaxID=6252 RepID=A0A0M3IQK1_ASCLU